MSKLNNNYNNLENNYLFAEIASRVAVYKENHPDEDVISMGIGDVTLPLIPAAVQAMKDAADEMGEKSTFRGYGPYEGYDFLRDAISGYYARRGVTVASDEIFISDGAKTDLGALLELFEQGLTAAIPDPVYPAYLDASIITGNKVKFIDGDESNNFLPGPPDFDSDILYLCSPNNPTGAVYTSAGLKEWVDYANSCGAVILFDAAYESFISDDTLPHSIYEIEGSEKCAIEISSFSKLAGFTGTRCGYTIIPKALKRGGKSLNELWNRRIAIKYNGTSYVIQKAAAEIFSVHGLKQTMDNLDYYKENAKIIGRAFDEMGITYIGGTNSPYIWFKCPDNLSSWHVFDLFLNKARVVCTPGSGFGKNGEGWVRLTAFGSRENTVLAMERIKNIF